MNVLIDNILFFGGIQWYGKAIVFISYERSILAEEVSSGISYSHGLITWTPLGRKSDTLRVTMIRLFCNALTLMSESIKPNR
jgi:hypothetical protein